MLCTYYVQYVTHVKYDVVFCFMNSLYTVRYCTTYIKLCIFLYCIILTSTLSTVLNIVYGAVLYTVLHSLQCTVI